MLIKTEVVSYTMLFIENETKCPACGSEATRRVRRQGLERACLDRVFECGDCQARFARPKQLYKRWGGFRVIPETLSGAQRAEEQIRSGTGNRKSRRGGDQRD